MNPDLDDPNNHVPPVSPGDDWGDLDESASEDAPVEGLPPRRPDRGIPARKEMKSAARVNHHAPKLKLHEDSSYSPLEPQNAVVREVTEPGGEEPAPAPEKPEGKAPAPAKAGRKTAKKAAKKTAKKAVRKTAKKAAGKSAGKKSGEVDDASTEKPAPTVPGSEVPDAAEPAEERIVLPPVQGNRRFRVNEIGPMREAMDRPVPKMEPKPKAGSGETGDNEVSRSRRRHVRGERGDWGANAAEGSFRWMLYAGAGIIALVIAAVVFSQRVTQKAGRGEQSFFSQIAPDESERDNAADLATITNLQAAQDEAKRIYAIYMTAKTADDFISSVFRAEENGGLIAENWKPRDIPDGWKPGDEAVWSALEIEGLRYGLLEGSLPDFTAFRAIFRHEGESLKLDWKATTGYSSADFSLMKKGRGDGSEIRAFLSPADFHTFALPEGEFRCFKLVSPDGQSNLWGYTKVGGELDGKLLAQFIPSQITGEAQAEIAVVLGLQPGPEDALPSQWMITRLVRQDWLDE